MEDYQLPTKFKRVMMDEAEINAINVRKLKQIMIQKKSVNSTKWINIFIFGFSVFSYCIV